MSSTYMGTREGQTVRAWGLCPPKPMDGGWDELVCLLTSSWDLLGSWKCTQECDLGALVPWNGQSPGLISPGWFSLSVDSRSFA